MLFWGGEDEEEGEDEGRPWRKRISFAGFSFETATRIGRAVDLAASSLLLL